MGFEIQSDREKIWFPLTAVCGLASLVFGLWLGPKAIYYASTFGVIFAAIGFFRRTSRLLMVILFGTHFLLLSIGFGLDVLFLMPLSDTTLKMPNLTVSYVDPEGLFHVRGPKDWDQERLVSSMEVGVRFRPVGMSQYMGVSDLTVRIRQLDRPSTKKSKFFERLAQNLSNEKDAKTRLFHFETRPATLLNKEKGLWSDLEVERFWVPLKQLALFGLKGQTFLCSVSATGIKSHSTLAEALCLNVYESIKIGKK